MSKSLLAIVSAISVAIAAVLIIGCFVRLGIEAGYITQNGIAHTVYLFSDGGRMVIDDQIVRQTPLPARWILQVIPPRIRMPDAKRLLWEFDAKTINFLNRIGRIMVVEFPVWVALLPCLIAPSIWIKRRLQIKKESRGFSVIRSDPV